MTPWDPAQLVLVHPPYSWTRTAGPAGTIDAMAKVVRNPRGHPESLRPLPKGNTISAKHGVYSDRLREPRAQQIFEAIMEAPHTVPLDSIFPVLSAG